MNKTCDIKENYVKLIRLTSYSKLKGVVQSEESMLKFYNFLQK